MKKIFAVFCAVVLMPSFSAQAWIGGPFSNNSFLGESGDDGVYEAAATAMNGIGLFRISVGHNFPGIRPEGVNASVPSMGTVQSEGDTPIPVPGISSGNVVIGAWGSSFTNIWYYEGVYYEGITFGTASSAMGTVTGFARADGPSGIRLSSAFIARFDGNGKFLPVRVFSGSGEGQLEGGDPFPFDVYGSKVSNKLTFGL